MIGSENPADDPALLLEAARVFNAAGSHYRGAAPPLAKLAWEKSLSALGNGRISDNAPISQEVATAYASAGDVAALLLGGRLFGGYAEALAILTKCIGEPGVAPDNGPAKLTAEERQDPNPDKRQKIAADDSKVRLYLLRALACGQQYNENKDKGLMADDAQMKELRGKIFNDLKYVFERRSEWARLNSYFWLHPASNENENDLAEAYNDAKASKDENNLASYLDSKVN